MNYLEELKRIKNLTSDLVTDMIVNNPELDEISLQLVKYRAELDKIIDVLECDAADENDLVGDALEGLITDNKEFIDSLSKP